ncbi:MAG TPA: division/cell wall cluster transcriptional repressor MraZ [Rugosimonospora sp.]|nr:division/cell wall cluster transcriptional repressor MraZ [Rugosimonospora sp.]
MFLGQYQHSLDDKGRLILPAKFRGQLEDGAYMARGLDGCVCVYPTDEWERVSNNMRELSTRGPQQRQAARSFFAGAAEVTPDKQGRVPVPAHLREFGGLSLDRDVVVAGVLSRVEIWDAERWAQREQEGEQVITAAEGIPDFGI